MSVAKWVWSVGAASQCLCDKVSVAKWVWSVGVASQSVCVIR